MNYLEVLCCFSAGLFTGYLLFGSTVKWKRIIVKPDGRGPNADVAYNGIKVEKERYAFTDEALDIASERAAKVWP